MSRPQVASTFRAMIPAARATPTPPLGPALGQRGVKSMDFCKIFNERTKNFIPETPVPTVVTVKPDRTFTFVVKLPPTAYLLKRAAGVEKGAGRPVHEIVGRVSLKHVYEIALLKQQQVGLERVSLQSVVKCVVATARGMGIEVVP